MLYGNTFSCVIMQQFVLSAWQHYWPTTHTHFLMCSAGMNWLPWTLPVSLSSRQDLELVLRAHGVALPKNGPFAAETGIASHKRFF